MQIGQRRIPFRVLKRIEILIYVVFPTVAGFAIYLGVIRRHAAFFVAAAIALIYEGFMYKYTAQHLAFAYSLTLHSLVFLVIVALHVIGFEYYWLGTVLLSFLGVSFGCYLMRIAFGDATFRETPDANGNHDNPV